MIVNNKRKNKDNTGNGELLEGLEQKNVTIKVTFQKYWPVPQHLISAP